MNKLVRYFIEVAYKGTNYRGFQIQKKGDTIQSEVEKCLFTILRIPVSLTGSSRTDAGVHALQNYFHFDLPEHIVAPVIYKLNAVLPADIVVVNCWPMPQNAHARFDAVSRTYGYRIIQQRNPFLTGTALYYPFKLNQDLLTQGAAIIKTQKNFFVFSKTNSQVNNFECTIEQSTWSFGDNELVYTIEANRFLRGMVRLIVGSLIKIGRGQLSLSEFERLCDNHQKIGLSSAACGLYLVKVQYPNKFFFNSGAAFSLK